MVDQILSNLVDNAIKYAGWSATGASIWTSLRRDDGWRFPFATTDLASCPKVVRRLFRPFSKSAHDAAQSAPGVGLGLALSRRLARALGGDLRLEREQFIGSGVHAHNAICVRVGTGEP